MEVEQELFTPLAKLAIAAGLLAICVVVHAAGLVSIWAVVKRALSRGRRNRWRELWLLIRITWAIIGLHVVSILVWSVAYVLLGCLPDHQTSFYFSSITYTTVGYGDVVLPFAWRSLSGIEAISGIFLAGLSTAFFFAFVSRMFDRE